jgi:alkylmercury lyase
LLRHLSLVRAEQVAQVLASLADLEVDDGGNVVGWGLTLIPTPHRFRLNGQQFYTWCALDALIYPALLQFTANVESSCPVSVAPVKLSVTPAGVDNLTPAGAVVSLVIPEPGSSCNGDRGSFCTQSLFFRSRRDALLWQASSPNAWLLSVTDAYQVGSLTVHYRYPS